MVRALDEFVDKFLSLILALATFLTFLELLVVNAVFWKQNFMNPLPGELGYKYTLRPFYEYYGLMHDDCQPKFQTLYLGIVIDVIWYGVV